MFRKRKKKNTIRNERWRQSVDWREMKRDKEKQRKKNLEGMEGDWKRRRKPFSVIFSITVVVEKLTK